MGLTNGGQAHGFQALLCALADLGSGQTEERQRKGDFRFDTGVEDLLIRVLPDVADPLRQARHFTGARLNTANGDAAAGRQEQAQEVLDQGALAGAILADDDDVFPLFDIEGDTF